jgi:hypothetical protein
MDGRMRLTLLVVALTFTAFFVYCAFQRKQQLELAERTSVLESQWDAL